MRKLFLALWPDDRTRRRVAKITGSLSAAACKKVATANIHVTLVFIGMVEDDLLPEISRRVSAITTEPFTVQFDRLSYWRKPKILSLTSQNPPDAIRQLAGKLTAAVAACDIATEDRPYVPHVTLARHAGNKPDMDFKPVIWHADSLCLIESTSNADGACYQVLQSWTL